MNINCMIHVGYTSDKVVLGHDGDAFSLQILKNSDGAKTSMLKEDIEELIIACSALLAATEHLNQEYVNYEYIGDGEFADAWDDLDLEPEPEPVPKQTKLPRAVGKTLAEALADGSLTPKS